MQEITTLSRWRFPTPPKRILAIRLQALGDTVITLPYLQSLQDKLPDTKIDFLTRSEMADIPRNLDLFHRVYSVGGRQNFKKQVLCTFLLLPKLLTQNYDIVIDLQRNEISQLIRRVLHPKSWSEFDRFSPFSAGERTRSTIEAIGYSGINISPIKLKSKFLDTHMLKDHGWRPSEKLFVLNPAGCFPTKNWPLHYYVEFAKLFLRRNPRTQFLILGTDYINDHAQYFESALHPHLINLVNKTTPVEALGILHHADFILTEDSGLMQMAWVAGVPTLALFGSSRGDWSAPQGEHSLCLDSSDLPCGECMEAVCKFDDVHCLTRYTPEMVFKKATDLLEKAEKRESAD